MIRLRRALLTLREIVRSRIQIALLRRRINHLKLLNYDLLAETVQGLRRVVETQERALDDLYRQLDARGAQIKQLQAEYAALAGRQTASNGSASEVERLNWFKRLQSVAVQLPTLRAALSEGAALTVQDVLALVAPFDEALRDLGFEAIGDAGSSVAFDPTRHHAVGRGAKAVVPGDLVRVRYIGYVYEGKVLCKAEVTRVQEQEAVRSLN